MSAALPSAGGYHINESGQPIEATIRIVYNGMSAIPACRDEARRICPKLMA